MNHKTIAEIFLLVGAGVILSFMVLTMLISSELSHYHNCELPAKIILAHEQCLADSNCKLSKDDYLKYNEAKETVCND